MAVFLKTQNCSFQQATVFIQPTLGLQPTKSVVQGATAVRLEFEHEVGDTEVKTWLIDKDGTSRGAYFVEVARLSKKKE